VRILIANRGEIAVRLTQACHELGHEAIAIYAPADRGAKHVQLADAAYEVRGYLDARAVIRLARRAKAGALHPGYGFLSENPAFAEACQAAGLVWIGPPPEVIRLMGDKLAAKRLAAEAGLRLVPGSEADNPAHVGFPLLIKAAAGGGGKGMRTVHTAEEFPETLASAKREAEAAFGDGRVFLERQVTHARHVEVQLFGDVQGRVIQLGERDCSIQRRYQKIIEESPAPHLPDSLRKRLHASAVALGKAAGYVGPGTVEFLVDGDAFYFLEMNTRLQVEHPVTEVVTGIDLAKLQIQVALGEPLATRARRLATPNGHGIEARVYAEDPAAGFLPSSGVIRRLELPQGPGIRNDAGIQLGDQVGIAFDPLLAKLIVWGADRAEAVARLRDALRRYCVLGLATNLEFLLNVAESSDFGAGKLSTEFVETNAGLVQRKPPRDLRAAAGVWASLRTSSDPFRTGRLQRPTPGSRPLTPILTPDGGLFLRGRRYYLAEDEQRLEVWRDGRRAVFAKPQPPSVDQAAVAGSATAGEQSLTAPLTGMVVNVLVEEGQRIHQHQTLLVLEAMKMEHAIPAPFAGVVKRVHVRKGVLAQAGAALIDLLAS
jgi:3-methylcrotonyl-CoA carboxylase alpha subunit